MSSRERSWGPGRGRPVVGEREGCEGWREMRSICARFTADTGCGAQQAGTSPHPHAQREQAIVSDQF